MFCGWRTLADSILDPGRGFFGEGKIYQRRNINPRWDYSELCHDVDVVLEPLDIDQGVGLIVVVLGRIYPIRVLLNRDLSDVGHLLDRVHSRDLVKYPAAHPDIVFQKID